MTGDTRSRLLFKAYNYNATRQKETPCRYLRHGVSVSSEGRDEFLEGETSNALKELLPTLQRTQQYNNQQVFPQLPNFGQGIFS